MGHGSDKLYVTYSEHSSGSHSASSSGAQRKQSNFAKVRLLDSTRHLHELTAAEVCSASL